MMIFQLLASGMVLAAFTLAQTKTLTTHSTTYVLLNFVGPAILAFQAFVLEQWGFLLLEGIWAIVALISLARSTAQRYSRNAAGRTDG